MSVRVGIIGYGLAGRLFHAPFIACTPGLHLTHVVTRSPERAAEAADDHPGVTVVAGVAEVVREAYPDHTQFDPNSKYHDPKSDPDNPRWHMVNIRYVGTFATPIPLPQLKETPGLEEMVLLKRGSRLSIQPVTAQEWTIINKLGKLVK